MTEHRFTQRFFVLQGLWETRRCKTKEESLCETFFPAKEGRDPLAELRFTLCFIVSKDLGGRGVARQRKAHFVKRFFPPKRGGTFGGTPLYIVLLCLTRAPGAKAVQKKNEKKNESLSTV